MNSWSDPRNAEIYDAFARKHPMYRETSMDLVELADIGGSQVTVDLACGTGVSTEAILSKMDKAGRVVAIDGSEAMLQVARERLHDERAQFVNADASDVAAHANEADAIICNSAIWQTDMEATMVACSKALRSGGRLAFNIGRQFLMMRFSPEELRPTKPTLFQLIQAVAVLEHGFAPPHPAASRGPRRTRGPLTPDTIESMIADSGLTLEAKEEREYSNTPEAQLDWISVPVFADNVLAGMPYDQQLEAIKSAYERFDKESGSQTRWVVFVARKP